MSSIRPRSIRTTLLTAAGVCGAVVLSMVTTAGVHRAMDWYILSHADPAMTALAGQAGMSREGRLVFLRARPQLVSDKEMQIVCADNTAANNQNGFIEQGCYTPATNRIYLRQMPANLHKLEISTAAYEMLHPVYISLHRSARAAALDQAIEAGYTARRDAKLTAQVANFARTEPGARDLELFSLLATGYTDLSDDLPPYYAPYFDNIKATVAATQAIEQLFQQNQDQLAQLQSQISRYDGLADQAYAASAVQARAGNATGNDYYYGLYRQYLKQENTTIGQYNGVLASYNTLVTEYNGTQPVRQITPAQTQTQ